MSAVDNIQNSINKAVDTIVKRRIEQLELDKTILAIIRSNEGFVRGQNIYRLEYNGGYFNASARNGEQYRPGIAVYVLIPQGDFSKDKFIISRASTKTTGQQQAVSIATASDYGIVGKNIVETIKDYPEPYGVRSYHNSKSEDITKNTGETDEEFAARKQALVSHRYNFLYQNGFNGNKVKVSNNDILKFKDEATAVMLKADFLTSLTSEQRSSAIGEYGLAINLIFKNLAAGHGDIWGEVFNNFAPIVRLPQNNPENTADIEWGTRTLQDLDKEICDVIGIDKEDINNIRWDKEPNTQLDIIGKNNLIDQKLNELKSNIQLFYDTYEGNISTIMRTLVSNYTQTLEDIVVQTTVENAKAVYEQWWKADTGAQEANKIVTYYLTSSDMIGNPFSFTSWTSQYSVFSIDLENFLGIDSILFYKKGFNISEKKESKLIEPNDIQVKNVQFYLMKPIADYNGQYQLKVEADDHGMVFKTKDDSPIVVHATLLREMYENLTKNSKTIIYWFAEDAAVNDRTKPGFREYAGLGWRVLNDSSEYVLNQEYWEIKFVDAPAYENHFRCVAVYDGQEDQVVLRYDFTVYNNTKQQFVLESDLGTNFGFDAGKPTLTIYKVDKDDEENPYKSLEQNKYHCDWTLLYQGQTIFFSEMNNNVFGMGDGLTGEMISRMPSITSLLKNVKMYTYDTTNNQYIEAVQLNQASQIQYPMANVAAESKVTFEVFISEKEENSENYNFVGKVILDLSNSGVGNVNNYRLVIENGEQVFQYNEYGSAPKEGEFKDKQKILPLKAVVYSPANIAITEQNFQTKWIFPADKKRTLIVYEGGKYDAGTQAANTFTGQQVTFDINDYYDYNKMDNQILCQVQFGDKLLEAKTNFLFTKVGNNGTNGTEVVGKISPKIDIMKLREQPVTVLTYYDENGNKQGFLNYNGPGTARDRIQITKVDQSYSLLAFIAQLYQKSDPLTIDSLKWNIAGNLKTKVNINGKDFSVEDNEIVWTGEENTESNNYYHQYIIEAEMRHGDNVYYAFQGIPVIDYNVHPDALWKNRIGIENDSYLKEIVYNSDGRNPLYNAYQGVKLVNLPLEEEKRTGENSVASKGWIIHWSAIGGYNASESMPMFSLLLSPEADKKTAVKDFWTAENDMIYILPNDEISGNITNNNVKAEVYVGDPSKIDKFLRADAGFSQAFDSFYDESITNERTLLTGLSNNWKKLFDALNSSADLTEIENCERTFDDNEKALYKTASSTQTDSEEASSSQTDSEEENSEKLQPAQTVYEELKEKKAKLEQEIKNLTEDTEEFRAKKEELKNTEYDIKNIIGEINNLEWANREIPVTMRYRMNNLLKSLQRICNTFFSQTLIQYFPTESAERPTEFAYWSKDLLNDKGDVITDILESEEEIEDKYTARTAKRREIIYQKILNILSLGTTIIRERFYEKYNKLFGEQTKNELIVLNKMFDLANNWISNNAIQAWINYCLTLDEFKDLNLDENAKNKIIKDFIKDFDQSQLTPDKQNKGFLDLLTNSLIESENITDCSTLIKDILTKCLNDYFDNTVEETKENTWKNFVKRMETLKNQKYDVVLQTKRKEKEEQQAEISDSLVVRDSILKSDEIDAARMTEEDNFLEEKTPEEIEKEKWDLLYEDLLSNIRVEFNKIYSIFYSKLVIDPKYKALYNRNSLNFELIATVYAPIHMSLNTFGLASLNGWDGTHITMNEDDGYFLAPQIGAGFKDNNNRFTGILMGKAGQYGDKEEQHTTGLFGYSAGAQSIFLDAETGNATFGLPNLKDKNGKELDYVEYYDGDEKQIKDSYNEGQIKLIPGGVSTIGGWRFGQQSLYYTDSKEIGSGYRTDYVPDTNNNEIRLLDIYHSNHIKDINHNDSGILLHSGKNPYISIKGRLLTEKDIAGTKNNNNLRVGDSLEVQLEPNTPTLFTIFRHNGINRGSPNSRTYLAGINSKGELVANVIGTNISADDDGTNGKTSTMTVQSLSAFGDYTSEQINGAARMSYVGLNMILGINVLGRVFVENAGDSGVQNLYFSGGGYGTSEYARPISMHGRKIALFTAVQESLSGNSTTQESSSGNPTTRNDSISINTKTQTDSGIILEPTTIQMTLPHIPTEWDYDPTPGNSNDNITPYQNSHAVHLKLSNEGESYLKIQNKAKNNNGEEKANNSFSLEVKNNIKETSVNGNIVVNSIGHQYTNTTGIYLVNASNSITLNKTGDSSSSLLIDDTKIELIRDTGSLTLTENTLTGVLPQANTSAYEWKIGGNSVIHYDNTIGGGNIPYGTDEETAPDQTTKGNLRILIGNSGYRTSLLLSASDNNYYVDKQTLTYPFSLQFSGEIGSIQVNSKVNSRGFYGSKLAINGMGVLAANGVKIKGSWKKREHVGAGKNDADYEDFGLIVEKGVQSQTHLFVGKNPTSSTLNEGTIQATASVTTPEVVATTSVTAPDADSYKFASQESIKASGTKHGSYQTERTANGKTLEALIQDCLNIAASAYNKANEAWNYADTVNTHLGTLRTTYNKHTHSASVTGYPKVTLSATSQEATNAIRMKGSYKAGPNSSSDSDYSSKTSVKYGPGSFIATGKDPSVDYEFEASAIGSSFDITRAPSADHPVTMSGTSGDPDVEVNSEWKETNGEG